MTTNQFSVLFPSGQRSKPASRSDIQTLAASRRIPDDATVVAVGTTLRIPVADFVSDGWLAGRLVVADEVQSNPLPVSRPKAARSRSRAVVVLASLVLLAGAFGSGWLVARASSPNHREAVAAPDGRPGVNAAAELGAAAAGVVQAAGNVAAVVDEESIRELVRTYLRDNLNSGEWDEVRWESSVPMVNATQWDALWTVRERLLLTPAGDVFSSLRSLNSRQPQNGPLILARLRFRTANGFGQPILSDTVFEIADGVAVPVADELQSMIQRSWAALEAGQHGQVVDVPATPEEQQGLDGQELIWNMIDAGRNPQNGNR